MRDTPSLLLTCEHGGNDVPAAYRPLFDGAEDMLASHRGWDPGALAVAQGVAQSLGAPLIFSTTTRLLVELNRTPGSGQLFSAWTRDLPEPQRQVVLDEHYRPYRRRVESAVAAHQPTLHVSIHSFTDVLDGDVRDLEVGVLYDPARQSETGVADALLAALAAAEPGWRLARNAPYAGTDDGLTTDLRTRHADADYAGIEIELRQGLLADPANATRAADALSAAIRAALRTEPGTASPQ